MDAMRPVPWTAACRVENIDAEDVIRFDHDGHCFAIYRTADDRYFATDGLCTHEQALLTDGLVAGSIIECPKHNGRFDFTTGKATRRPACIDLKTYAVKVEAGTVFVLIDPQAERR
jgi:3-phenylpropionate/trans-cinnamate dioxygenase ferredoxin subunit